MGAIMMILNNVFSNASIVHDVLEIIGLKISQESLSSISWMIVVALMAVQIYIVQKRYLDLLKPKKPFKGISKNEEKHKIIDIYSGNCLDKKLDQPLIKEYIFNALYIEISNTEKRNNAENVWARIEWLDKKGESVLSHDGNWDYPDIKFEQQNGKLKYANFNSNKSSKKLYFACIDKNNQSKTFYGVCRDDLGHEKWIDKQNELFEGIYTVKINLKGSDGIEQEFEYSIICNNNILYIEKALSKESEKFN